MGGQISVGQPARYLVTNRQVVTIRGSKTKVVGSFIPWLFFRLVIIDGIAVDPWRCPRFETLEVKPEVFKALRQFNGRLRIIWT